MTETAEFWIEKLRLLPHPEGGFYREVYRSEDNFSAELLSKNYEGQRSIATSIYFLLKKDQISAFHRLASDEIWHHYLGASVKIYAFINEELKIFLLGKDVLSGESVQVIVPKNCWFAAEITGEESFALVGCTVAPGFDVRDFELAEKSTLLNQFPHHKKLIEKMCIR